MKMEKYRDVWATSFTIELRRLAQGIRDVEGTNTIMFIKRSQVPTGRKVTYGRLVCDHRPQKKEKNRTRLTVGGDRLDYPHVNSEIRPISYFYWRSDMSLQPTSNIIDKN